MRTVKHLLWAVALLLATTPYASAQHKQTKAAPAQRSWIDEALSAKAEIEARTAKGLPVITEVRRKGDEPIAVDVDLTGLKELVLVTWATPDGNNFDHATWGDAVLTTKDGKKVWLDELPFKFKKVDGDWFRLKTNFSGDKFSIGSRKFSTGILAHANSLLVFDLTGADYSRFTAFAGIDNGAGAAASAVFKVLVTSGVDEAASLIKKAPQITSKFLPYIGATVEEWLTTPGTTIERAAAMTTINKLTDKTYMLDQLKRVEGMTDKKAQVEEYIRLIANAAEILRLQGDLQWLNVRGVKLAFADFKTNKNYDAAKWQPLYDEFIALVEKNKGFSGIYSLDKPSVEALYTALKLKRQIILSNPALDFDKIVATRYHIGSNARKVEPNAMGTQPNNWSSQLSAQRGGFDAQIVELTGLRNDKLAERVIYKPTAQQTITDVQLHWDADRMIFTSNDEKGRWQIFEVGTDGKNFQQVTNAEDADLEFFDGAYLPSGKMIVNSNMGYHGVPCVNGADAIGNFSVLDPATGDLRRICFDQENNWHPTVMNSGRVMYTRWEYTDLMHYYSRIVFSMNPDGTEQKALYGSGSYFPNSTYDMQPLPGHASAFVGIITGHHGIIRSGRLIIFDPERSRKEEKGMVQEIPFSTRPIIPIVKDEMVNGVWPQFVKPHPITDKYFLVTAKLTPDGLWGIYLVDIYDNMTLIAEAEGEGFINPIPLKQRPTPPVIPDRVDTTKTTATVFIQDIYEGEGLPGVPRGTVKKLRVFTYEFAYLNTLSDHVAQGVQSGWDIKRELGEVDVEPDGSVIFTVPANTPIAVQPLDEQGRAIQLMRSWFTGMPGETVSCVGCHEDQNMIAMPKRVAASQKKPSAITPPKGGVRPFTFELEIQPILDRACVACHNGEGRVPLDFTPGRMDSIGDWAGRRYYSKSYLAFHPYFYRQGPEAEMYVLNPYEYATMNSEMFQILENNHHGVKLTDDEIKTLYKWLDFNVPYHSAFDATKFKAQSGDTIDQKCRRRELSEKYSGVDVNWEQEIADYAASLKAKGDITPVMPTEQEIKSKTPKVKGWPFTAEEAAAKVAGKAPRVVDLGNGQKLTFVYVPAGSYIAGGNGKAQTKAPYKVDIKKGFWMSTTELTNAQVRALLPDHNSRYVGQFWKDHTTPGYDVNGDELVATKISYQNAAKYAELLAQKTGLKVALPTEDQWEWAARAGSSSDFWFGDRNTDYAPYENLGDSQLSKMAVSGIDPVPMSKTDPWYRFQNYIPKDETVDDGNMLVTNPAQYKANAWGLYDMGGNVGEWTSSDFERSSAPSMVAADKVVRGGSWYERSKRATVATRRNFLPWQAPWNVGMRLIIEE